jgi:transcriptional regulator with XRE-family HTH domain
MDEIGREIRRLREEKGWTQAKLAVDAGIGVAAVSLIETGKRNPSATTLAKIAEALGVGVADLFPLGQAPLFREPPEHELPSEEQRAAWEAAWEAAAEEARRLRETGGAQMWNALSGWRASKKRGEPYAARREYLDEMGNLLQEVYDADEALGRAYIKAMLTTPGASEASFPSYLQEEARITGHFYGELLGLVKSVGLSVLTGDDAATAKQAAAGHVQSETRPLIRVEESEAA